MPGVRCSPSRPAHLSPEASSAPALPVLPQAKILEHDDVSYLKKILGELAMVLDQIEAELEKRKLENEGGCQPGRRGCGPPASPTPPCLCQGLFFPQRSQKTSRMVGILGSGAGGPRFTSSLATPG